MMKQSRRVRHTATSLLVFVGMTIGIAPARADGPEYRRLPVSEYRDKMKAGWIGQMAG